MSEADKIDEIMSYFHFDESPCHECRLWETSIASNQRGQRYRRSGVYGKGTGSNGMYFMGEALGGQEVLSGVPFVGQAGRIQAQLFLDAGIIQEHCFLTNTARCRPPNNRNPRVAESRTCQELHFEKDLPGKDPNWRPKLVIFLGAVALKHYTKLSKLQDRKGVFFDIQFLGKTTRAFATYHPANILRKPDLYDEVKMDLIRCKNFLLNKKLEELPKIKRAHINGEIHCRNWLKKFHSYADECSPDKMELTVDIETTGLRFWEHEIASIALTTQGEKTLEGMAFLTLPSKGWWSLDIQDRESEIFHLLTSLLERSDCTYHSGDFDTSFFWKHLKYPARNDFDTLDAHLMLDENPPHKLKLLVPKFIPQGAGFQIKQYEAVGEGVGFHQTPPPILLEYNIDDTFYTHLLRRLFTPMMKKDNVFSFFQDHAMRLKRSVTRMAYRGIRVHRERLMDLSHTYRKRIVLLRDELFNACGKEFNEGSNDQIRDILYTDLHMPVLKKTDGGAPSTDKDTLAKLVEETNHIVPRLISDVRHLKKMCSTYLDGNDGVTKDKKGNGLLDYLDERHRIHTNVLTQGTNSGRISTSKPSLLNIPKEKEFRSIFIPEDGMLFINPDYKTAEVILFAYLSGDENLKKASMLEDMHSQVLRDCLGLGADVIVEGAQRDMAKRVTFRKIYGGGAEGLVEQLGITSHQASEWYRQWDAAYPRAVEWMGDQAGVWRDGLEIVSIFGRKKRFQDLHMLSTVDYKQSKILGSHQDRVAINFPCQSGVGDATNRSLYLFDDALDRIFGWSLDKIYDVPGPVLTIHDEILAECQEDIVEDVAKLLKEIMSFPLPEIGVSLPVDMVIKENWGADPLDIRI